MHHPELPAGTQVPSTELAELRDGSVRRFSSHELFDQRRVILFALPGAFTPTCSTAHVPGYIARLQDFRDTGIDEIVCLAVNDPYVMDAWRRAEKAGGIRFVADPFAEFTRAIGMTMNHPENFLGERSRRYSMLINDGHIETMFIEADGPGDPFKVSDAETMWQYWRPNEKGHKTAFMLARRGCPFCAKARALLDEHGIVHDAVYLGEELSMLGVRAASGETTLPQVFIEGKLIGGADQLEAYLSDQ